MHKFGQRLAILRKEKGFSIRELAVAAGIKEHQVSQIEAGSVNLRFITILSLARALEISPDKLLETIPFGDDFS